MQKVLYGFYEQLNWLETLSYNSLETWMLGFVKEDNSYPILISTDSVSPFDHIRNFFEVSKNSAFKKKIKKVIVESIASWRLSIDEDSELFELSSLVSLLCISNKKARSKLLTLVKEGNLQGRHYRGIDLHFHVLRVLAGLKLSIDLKSLINRDFDNPAYAPILFTSCWLLSEKGYFLAIDLLDRFIDLYKKFPGEMDFHSPFETFIESFGKKNLKKHFNKIITKLSRKNTRFFLDALEEIGIYLNPDNDLNTFVYDLNSSYIRSEAPVFPVGNNPVYIYPPIKNKAFTIPSTSFRHIPQQKRLAFQQTLKNRTYENDRKICQNIACIDNRDVIKFLDPSRIEHSEIGAYTDVL